MNLFNLFATLTLDNSDYEKKLDKSQKSAGSFSSKIGTAFKTGVRAVAGFVTGVAAAGAAVAALVVNFVNAGSEIDDNAQKLGISTEAYQYWSLVLQRAGTDASQLSMAIRNMTTFTQELSTGNADALLTLQKLGIGYEDFMAMNTEEQLYAIVNALQGMKDQTDKVSIAQEIFGNRVYQELLPLLNMEQGSLEDLREEFEGLGFILSDNTIKNIAAVGDQLDNFTNAIKTAGLVIGANLLPEIELITEGLVGLANGSDDAMQSLSDGLTGLIGKIAKSLPTIISTAADLLLEIIAGLLQVIGDPNFLSSLAKVIETIFVKVIEILPSLFSSLYDIVISVMNLLFEIDWGTIIISILKTIIEIALLKLPSQLGLFLNLWTNIIDTILYLFTTQEGLNSIKEFGIILAETLINSIISGVENGINLLVDAVNALLGGISQAWTWLGIPEIPDIPSVSIPRVDFAKGGMFPDSKGTLYALAGESGAEIVARGARGTGVANVEQIADAQYMAMQDYDLRGAIQSAAVAIVNGVVSGLSNTTQDGGNTPVIVRIGDKDFNGYIVNTVNNSLRAQGRKSLNKITAYGGRG